MLDCEDLVGKKVVVKTKKQVYQGQLQSFHKDNVIIENNHKVIIFRVLEVYQDLY